MNKTQKNKVRKKQLVSKKRKKMRPKIKPCGTPYVVSASQCVC